MKVSRRGKIFVVSSPSGGGKTTLCSKLVAGDARLHRSVSFTTRPPRRGERNGRDYFFISRDKFRKKKSRGEFLEWALNFGYYYGTPRRKVEGLIKNGKDILLSIDVKGATQVKRKIPKAVCVFVLPPSLEVLRRRLERRNLDKKKEINKRLKAARREISCISRYDYCIVNESLKKALLKLKAIIAAERARI